MNSNNNNNHILLGLNEKMNENFFNDSYKSKKLGIAKNKKKQRKNEDMNLNEGKLKSFILKKFIFHFKKKEIINNNI